MYGTTAVVETRPIEQKVELKDDDGGLDQDRTRNARKHELAQWHSTSGRQRRKEERLGRYLLGTTAEMLRTKRLRKKALTIGKRVKEAVCRAGVSGITWAKDAATVHGRSG